MLLLVALSKFDEVSVLPPLLLLLLSAAALPLLLLPLVPCPAGSEQCWVPGTSRRCSAWASRTPTSILNHGSASRRTRTCNNGGQEPRVPE